MEKIAAYSLAKRQVTFAMDTEMRTKGNKETKQVAKKVSKLDDWRRLAFQIRQQIYLKFCGILQIVCKWLRRVGVNPRYKLDGSDEKLNDKMSTVIQIGLHEMLYDYPGPWPLKLYKSFSVTRIEIPKWSRKGDGRHLQHARKRAYKTVKRVIRMSEGGAWKAGFCLSLVIFSENNDEREERWYAAEIWIFCRYHEDGRWVSACHGHLGCDMWRWICSWLGKLRDDWFTF